MARKPRDLSMEQPQPDTAMGDEYVEPMPLVNETPHLGTVVRTEGLHVEPPARFRVRNGGTVMNRGTLVTMRPGKEVDAGNYDIDMLRTQGLDLEPL